jgi:class 3 adenylate cyclase
MKFFTHTYNRWLTDYVTIDSDHEEIILAKKIWFTLTVISVIMLMPNTVIYYMAGFRNWTLAGIVFVCFHILLLLIFHFLRRGIWGFIIAIQIFYMTFSFILVLLTGGILYSGGSVFIGLVGGPFLSAIFFRRKVAYLVLGIYLASVIIELLAQPLLTPDPDISPAQNLLFFVVHLVVVSTAILGVLSYFIEQNKNNQLKEKNLLYKILPAPVVHEMMEYGRAKPVRYEQVSVLFSDFRGFTNIVASIPASKLVDELNDIFYHFDDIIMAEGLEKIKTIGDGYLAVCGVSGKTNSHAKKCVITSQKMIHFLNKRNREHAIKWEVRIGIHSGPVTAGVVGKDKFTYDIFGDTVNIASRIETAGEAGRINVSAYTYELIRDEFPGEYRGKIKTKGKGDLDMYYLN